MPARTKPTRGNADEARARRLAPRGEPHLAIHPQGDTDPAEFSALFLLEREMRDLLWEVDRLLISSSASTLTDEDQAYFRQTRKDVEELLKRAPENERMRSVRNAWETIRGSPLLMGAKGLGPSPAPELHRLARASRQMLTWIERARDVDLALARAEFEANPEGRRRLSMLREKLEALRGALASAWTLPRAPDARRAYVRGLVGDIETIMVSLPAKTWLTAQLHDTWRKWQDPRRPRFIRSTACLCPFLARFAAGDEVEPDAGSRQDPEVARATCLQAALADLDRMIHLCGIVIDDMPPPVAPGNFPRNPDDVQNLRLIRAELEDLVPHFVSIREGAVPIEHEEIHITQMIKQIHKRATRIPTQYEVTLRVWDRWCNIYDTWMHQCKPMSEHACKLDMPRLLQVLTRMESDAREMVRWLAYVTIPPRVNEWIDHLKVGQGLPFHDVFQDELIEQGMRDDLLRYLSWSPSHIERGVVDRNTGFIFRAAKNTRGDYIVAGVLTVLTLVILAGVTYSDRLLAALPRVTASFEGVHAAGYWLLILTGIFLQSLLGAYREMQKEGGGLPEIGSHLIARWIAARWVNLALKILVSLVVLAVAMAALGSSFHPLTAFLLGYGIDDVIETLYDTLESRATASQSAMRQAVSA